MNKKPRVKYALTRNLERYDGDYAVLLSGGADSHGVLFALMEMGRKAHIYTCCLEDRESRDFKVARKTAETFNLPFTPVWLPTDLEELELDIRQNVHDMDLKGKVETEALWALRKACDIIDEENIVGGLAAGIYFCLTKSGSIHYKKDRIDEYRQMKFDEKSNDSSQDKKMKRYCKTIGKKWVSPWVTRGMLKEFLGTSWDDVNRPRQKEPIRRDFEEYFEQIKVPYATDMHKGDSGISELFEKLLDDPKLNPDSRHKSVIGIYNRIYKEEKMRSRKGLLS